jgi:hypothetical protein
MDVHAFLIAILLIGLADDDEDHRPVEIVVVVRLGSHGYFLFRKICELTLQRIAQECAGKNTGPRRIVETLGEGDSSGSCRIAELLYDSLS